jgi:hypothetical protein
MSRNDDDNSEFRLRPGKPPIPRERRTSSGSSVAFRAVMKYARSSRAGRRPQAGRPKPHHLQHCAVRVSYASNRVAGHWRAHGRYIARESASLEPEKCGFGPDTAGVDIASQLRDWQNATDPRLWKLILSPEFGERMDLQQFTRDVNAPCRNRSPYAARMGRPRMAPHCPRGGRFAQSRSRDFPQPPFRAAYRCPTISLRAAVSC